MQGHFDLFLQNSRGLRDADFIAARDAGRLGALLETLPVEREVHSDNLVHQLFSICMFRLVFGHGLPNGTYPMSVSTGIPFYTVALLTSGDEPAYSDWWGGNQYPYNVPYCVSTTGYKRFVVNAEETSYAAEVSGREAVFLRSRWLFLPSEAVSNSIRSVGAYWSDTATLGAEDRGLIARARIKDTGGNPITLIKTSEQSLLVQYTATLVSL